MAKEKFLIIAVQMHEDCFPRFSESENRAAIDAGEMDQDDPYAWIESAFEIRLVRWREATHICSMTPSANYTWIQNQFVGQPNEAWEYSGDPGGLEYENGGERGGYGTYRDDYDPRFVCATFTIDTVKDLGLHKPRESRSLSRRSESESGEIEAYRDAIWKLAEEIALEMNCNGVAGDAPILDVWTYRQWAKECLEAARARSCEDSKRRAAMRKRGLPVSTDF